MYPQQFVLFAVYKRILKMSSTAHSIGKQAPARKGTAKKHREIILPAEIVNKIKSNATTEREALIGLRLTYAIYGRAIFNKFSLNEWFDVPCETLKAVNFDYGKYLYTFKDVIEFNGSWHNPNKKGIKGYCQKARFVIGGYHVTDFESVPIVTTEPQAASDIEHLATAVYKRLSLKIGSDILTEKTPFFRAALIITKYLTATFTEDWFMSNGKHIKPINDDEWLQLAQWVYDSQSKKWWLKKQFVNQYKPEKMTGEEYKNLCAYHELPAIHYKGLYVIGVTDLRKFVIEKLKDIHESAFFVLNSIRTGEYLPRRNGTNYRMDYAFTASGSLMSKIICCGSEPLFCQDLSNSQWVILGRLILNSFECKARFANVDTKHFADIVKGFELTKDVHEFAEHTGIGKVYDMFAEKNGLTRDDAKEAFMFFGFARNSTQHRFKTALTNTYPSVDAILTKFKDVHGYEQLPILLQRIESSLFVDCILADCLKNRLDVLTKHDSIYFTEKSRKKAIEKMKKHLDKHLISYHFKP